MLRDDLEKMKKEYPEGLETQIGACRFCGQMGQIEVNQPWEREEVNEAVTEMCDCYEARTYTRKKNQKERAHKIIEKQFGAFAAQDEEDRIVIELLHELSENIIEERIESATISIGRGIKAKISATAKGTIKVERAETKKEIHQA